MSSHSFRTAFPLFTHQPDLVYLDSAATALKPQSVIDTLSDYYAQYSTNVGRGLYPLAEQATERFEATRAHIARFIGARHAQEIIFTAGTTASLNLAAHLLKTRIQPEDTLITTAIEHHSNFLPWKELAKTTGAHFRIAPCTSSGHIDTEALLHLIDHTTKIVTFSALSNVFGIIEPVSDIIAAIKQKNPGVLVVIDAAQAVAHIPLSVSTWDADFVAFSGHKLYGPTGIGVLYGKQSLLETLSPDVFGGGMVLDACARPTAYKSIPHRFEAGTPHIAGVLGLDAAITFVESIGYDALRAHDTRILTYADTALRNAFGTRIHILGESPLSKRAGLLSFTFDDIHPHDLAHILGERNICIRAGEHCAAPLHAALSVPATARISFGLSTHEHDIDALIEGIHHADTILRPSATA